MKAVILTLFFIPIVLTAQEEFSFELYFEDAVGNRDTVTVGYDIDATSGIDNVLGEVNTLSIPWSENFEVRISDKMPSILYGEPANETLRTKKQIIKKYCGEAWSYWDNIYIDIKNLQFPIMISYDNGIFQNPCVIGSVLQNYEENAWFDVGFFDGYLSENNLGIQYNESLLTYQDEDGTTIHSFWLKIGDGSLLTLSNETLEKRPVFSVSPNPFKNQIELSSELPVHSLQLTDLQGKSIEFIQDNNYIYPLNYSSGVYILTYQIDDKTYFQKLIKE